VTFMRILGIVVLVVGLLLAGAAVFAPASLADRSIATNSGGKLRLAEAEGTIWNGSAQLTDAANSWRIPFQWSIPPRSLLADMHELVLTPAAGAAMPTGVVGVGRNATSLRNFSVEIPAQALAGMLAVKGGVTLGGSIVVTTPAFDWNGTTGNGTLAAQWRDARIALGNAVASLGAVDINLAPDGNRLAGRIGNSGGDVRIDGTIGVNGTVVDVNASIAPQPSAPPHIALALAALGTPDSAGAVRVAWRGALK
jgi:hypothetical protein